MSDQNRLLNDSELDEVSGGGIAEDYARAHTKTYVCSRCGVSYQRLDRQAGRDLATYGCYLCPACEYLRQAQPL